MQHYLLMSPLHRAVSLEQMNDASVVVAQKLNFDVSRSFDELQTVTHSMWRLHFVSSHLFHEQTSISECTACLRERPPEQLLHILDSVDPPHSPASSSISGLQNNGSPVLLRELDSLLRTGDGGTRSRHNLHACLDCCLSGCYLQIMQIAIHPSVKGSDEGISSSPCLPS